MRKNAFYFTLKALFIFIINAMHILPNISRSKGNRAMLFGQLLEYNMRNTFVEKSYTKGGGKTFPRSFFQKLELSVSLDQ